MASLLLYLADFAEEEREQDAPYILYRYMDRTASEIRREKMELSYLEQCVDLRISASFAVEGRRLNICFEFGSHYYIENIWE